MPETQRAKNGAVLGAWALAYLFSRIWAWRDPNLGCVDAEAAINATQGVMASWVPWSELPQHAYKGFCTGCSLWAPPTNVVFALFGEGVLVWKLWALMPGMLLLIAYRTIAYRIGGPRTVHLTMAAAVLAPYLLWLGGTRGWLNHFEAASVAWCAIALHIAGVRPALVGFTASLAACVSLSGSFALLALMWLERQDRTRLIRLVAGASPLLLLTCLIFEGTPWGLGVEATARAMPGSLSAVWALLSPRGMELWLGSPTMSWLWLSTAGAFVASAGMAMRVDALRPVLVAMGCWCLMYWLSPYTVYDAGGDGAHAVHGYRYAIPLLSAGPILVGAATHRLALNGPVGFLLLAAWSLPGGAYLLSIASSDVGPHDIRRMSAPAWPEYRAAMARGDRSVQPASWNCDDEPRCSFHQAFMWGRLGEAPSSPLAGWCLGRAYAMHGDGTLEKQESTLKEICGEDLDILLAEVWASNGVSPQQTFEHHGPLASGLVASRGASWMPSWPADDPRWTPWAVGLGWGDAGRCGASRVDQLPLAAREAYREGAKSRDTVPWLPVGIGGEELE